MSAPTTTHTKKGYALKRHRGGTGFWNDEEATSEAELKAVERRKSRLDVRQNPDAGDFSAFRRRKLPEK